VPRSAQVDEDGFVSIKVLKKDKTTGKTEAVDTMSALKDKKKKRKKERKERPARAPAPQMNSRAAEFAAVEGAKNKLLGGPEGTAKPVVRREDPRAAAPVVSSRFAKILEEVSDRNTTSEPRGRRAYEPLLN